MPISRDYVIDQPKMEYIKLYGKPENDQYDAIKLDEICKKLNFVYNDKLTYSIIY
jgi:hypothetical protein